MGPLRALASVGQVVARVIGAGPRVEPADPAVVELLGRAADAVRAGRVAEARRIYRQVLERRRNEPAALRGLRDLAMAAGDWQEALEPAERVAAHASGSERAAAAGALAGVHHELGRAEVSRGRPTAAVAHFKNALRADRTFVPAALALGDAHEAAGDLREAVRVWERSVETQPVLPLLARLEAVYRRDGRPSRMIALYRAAVERAPDDLALGLALGRVYFELEMLHEAADQLEKIEIRAPDVAAVHALLGAVFEHRGDAREALAEYRRALQLAGAFEWAHRCAACGAPAPGWRERCVGCGAWNVLRPVDGR